MYKINQKHLGHSKTLGYIKKNAIFKYIFTFIHIYKVVLKVFRRNMIEQFVASQCFHPDQLEKLGKMNQRIATQIGLEQPKFQGDEPQGDKLIFCSRVLPGAFANSGSMARG